MTPSSKNSSPVEAGVRQAKRVKDFMQEFCLLSRDRFAKKPIELLPWQSEWIDRFFGTGRTEGDFFRREFSRSSIWIARKNGKSSFMAALALWLCLEKAGNEVIVIAPSIKLAKIIYSEAAFMAKAHPSLAKIFWVRDHLNKIVCRHNNSIIQVLSGSNPNSVSGWNGDVLIDEISSLPPSTCNQIWGKLQSTGAARENSALISISHANYYLGEHIGYQQYLHARAVLDARQKGEPEIDRHLLPVVYSADLDKVDSPDEWRRVNPGIPKIISPDEFAADYARAKADSREWARFLLFRMNCYVGSADNYIPIDQYEAAEADFAEEDLWHKSICIGSVDLSRRRDLTAVVWLVAHEGLIYLIPRLYTPASTLAKKSKDDKVPYEKWVEDGHIIATEGDSIDQEFLMEEICKDAENFDPLEIRYDPWGADLLAQGLQRKGLQMAEAPCNRSSFLMPPTCELERAFAAGKIRLPRNPCLKWNFQNAVVRRIGADGIIVNKSACTARVDGCVASILAMSGYMAHQDALIDYSDSMIIL